MKYIAEIKVHENDLKEILAKYFGVTTNEVYFRYTSAQNEGYYVECIVKRSVDVPGTFDALLTGNYVQLEGDVK